MCIQQFELTPVTLATDEGCLPRAPYLESEFYSLILLLLVFKDQDNFNPRKEKLAFSDLGSINVKWSLNTQQQQQGT